MLEISQRPWHGYKTSYNLHLLCECVTCTFFHFIRIALLIKFITFVYYYCITAVLVNTFNYFYMKLLHPHGNNFLKIGHLVFSSLLFVIY